MPIPNHPPPPPPHSKVKWSTPYTTPNLSEIFEIHLRRILLHFTQISRLHAAIAAIRGFFNNVKLSRHAARALPWLLTVAELNHA